MGQINLEADGIFLVWMVGLEDEAKLGSDRDFANLLGITGDAHVESAPSGRQGRGCLQIRPERSHDGARCLLGKTPRRGRRRRCGRARCQAGTYRAGQRPEQPGDKVDHEFEQHAECREEKLKKRADRVLPCDGKAA
jgi:hypothetical protein